MQSDQFFRLNEKGMKDVAAKNNIKLLISNAQSKIEKEVQLIENYIVQQVDAILVSPISMTASLPALEKARAAGIKIIIYNTPLNEPFGDFYITSDQYQLGSSTGEYVKKYINEKLEGKAKIAIIQFVSASPEFGHRRPDGFLRVIKEMKGVEIMARQDAWLAHTATEKVETLLGGLPDLDIIWAANEGGTVGSVTAVRNKGLAGKVAVFGTDISGQLCDYLISDDNVLHAVTAQKPYEMGTQAMEAAVKLAKGVKPEKPEIILPGELFTNQDKESIKKVKANLSGSRS
jgi:ABC-type sugar transport system substrate-binding protein